MQFNTLLACASFVAAAVAQSSRIAFGGTIPTSVEAGSSVPISWVGGTGGSVTITLQKGPPDDLKDVTVLTVGQTGNPYNWIPSSALTNGDNYALRIDQATEQPNYTGQITLSGGLSASSSDSTTASSIASAASSAVASFSSPSVIPVASVNVTTTAVVSTSTLATQIVGTGVVGTGAVGTGVGASGSAATGTAMYRNSTMSSATLTRSSTASSSSATTTSSDSDSNSESAPSSTAGSGAAVTAASNFALLCAAVVGVMYLA